MTDDIHKTHFTITRKLKKTNKKPTHKWVKVGNKEKLVKIEKATD